MKIGSVTLNEAIYPRHRLDYIHVSALATAIRSGAQLPPIEVTRRGELLDGAHRLEAYRQVYSDDHVLEVRVLDLQDVAALEYAASVNARHGLRLSAHDMARTIALLQEHGVTDERICKALSITRERLDSLVKRVIPAGAVRESFPPKPVVLKRSLARLSSVVETEQLLAANQVVSGVAAESLARQLLAHLEADTYPRSTGALEVLWSIKSLIQSRYVQPDTQSDVSASDSAARLTS
ncbi:MAG: ParB/RepB/Spo0J family partition protein [Fimbriimonadales bacterium]|nr:ParB/RepB/Spo0J family partition protein [Fimbriimonadales bacterium]